MEYSIRTNQSEEFRNITDAVNQAVAASGIQDGLAVVFVPHTTAGLTINENADPDVVHDMLKALDRVYPENAGYRHAEGNSHAHLKASAMGASCTVIVEQGSLKLGIWQGIYFCEFDGPRNRKFYVKVL